MLIGFLQSLAFILTALLLTVWQRFVIDSGKFRSGIWCLVGSIALSGLAGAWIGTSTSYYYNVGDALSAILYALSVFLIFESLLNFKRVPHTKNETDQI